MPSPRLACLGAAAVVAAAGVAQPAWASPRSQSGVQVHQVVQGNVSFHNSRAGLTIRASNRSIIEYAQFNIGRGGVVRFEQPSADSVVLNRIVGAYPTAIDGKLVANGIVYIVNPAGVMFGRDSVINVGGLYAAAGSISNQDFRKGLNRFTTGDGSVVNHGWIGAEKGVHLIGPSVTNSGTIVTPRGMVSMTAGGEVYLGERGSSVLVRVDQNKASAQNPAIEHAGDGVVNTGSVRGGSVLLTTGDLYSLALTNHGEITSTGGRVTLDAGGAAVNTGTIDVSNRAPGAKGGEARLLGSGVEHHGVIDASGDAGGGRVLIGGDFAGARGVRASSSTIVGPDAVIAADAVTSGDGGRIAVWSDAGTAFSGGATARAGAQGGDGGFVEVSGLGELAFRGDVDASSAHGRAGHLLLDPKNITIGGGNTAPDGTNSGFGNQPDADVTISAGQIANILEGGTDVTLQANNDISVSTSINAGAGSEDTLLTMQAGRSITFTNNTDISTEGSLTLWANYTSPTDAALNTVIASNRDAGAGVITLGQSTDLTVGAGETMILRVNPNATIEDSGGVDVDFVAGAITLGPASGAGNRATLNNGTVIVEGAAGIVANANITASDVTLHSGTTGTGNITFATGANRPNISAADVTLVAGDGAGNTAIVDFTGDGPTLTGVSSYTHRQDATITGASLIGAAQFSGGPADRAYTLESAGAITLASDFAKVAGVSLTLNGDGVSLGSGAGDIALASLAIDAGAGNVAISSNINTGSGAISSAGADFATTATATLTGGAMTIDHTGDVAIGSGIASNGAVVEILANGGVTIDADIVSELGLVVHAGRDGTGDVGFGAGVTLASDDISLRAGSGNGVDNTAVVDLLTDAPTITGANPANSPDAFSVRQDAAITDTDLIDVTNFTNGVAGMDYALRSDGGSLTIADATNVNTTNLSLTGATGVTVDAALTLDGLALASGGDVAVNAGVDAGAGAFSSAGDNFDNTAGGSIAAGSVLFDHTGDVTLDSDVRIALGASSIGGNFTVTVTNNDAGTVNAITQTGLATVGGALDVTTAGTDAGILMNQMGVAGQVFLSTPAGATISNNGALTLGASTVGGALTASATSGVVSLADAMSVGGNAVFNANGPGGGISLPSNRLTLGGSLGLNTTGAAFVQMNQGVTLLNSTVGPLSLTATTIAAPSPVTVTGNAVLIASAGGTDINFADLRVSGEIRLTSQGTALIRRQNNGGITFGESSAATALAAWTSNGQITTTNTVSAPNAGGGVDFRAQGAAGAINAQHLNVAGLVLVGSTGAATIVNSGPLSVTTAQSALQATGQTSVGSLNATALSGAISDDFGLNVTGNAAFIADSPTGSITLGASNVGGVISLDTQGAASVTSATAVTLGAVEVGTSLFVQASDVNMTGGAGSVAVKDGFSGATITLRPNDAASAVGLGAVTGGFDVSATDLAAIGAGFDLVTIGRSDSGLPPADFVIGNVLFASTLDLRSSTGGRFVLNGSMTGSAGASLTMSGATQTRLGGNILTSGGAIRILTPQTVLTANAALRSTNAGGAGAPILVDGAVTGGGNALEIASGTGAARVAGAINNVSGLTVISGAAVDLFGAVSATGAITATGASLTTSALTSTAGGNISLTMDNYTLVGGGVSTTGGLLVQTLTPSRDIGLLATTGGLDFLGSEFFNLFTFTDFSSITIGRANGTGDIHIGTSGVFDVFLYSPTTFRSPGAGGQIFVNEFLGGDFNASLTFDAPTTRLLASIATLSNPITVLGETVVQSGNVSFDTTFGGAGAPISLGPVTAAAGGSLSLLSAGGEVFLNGNLGVGGALGNLTITGAGVRIAGDTQVVANNVSIVPSIDSAAGENHSFSVTAATTTLGGPIGGLDALSELAINGAATLSGGLVRTTGSQSYAGGALTLGNNTTLEGSDVRLAGDVLAGGLTLTVDADAALAGSAINAGSLTFLDSVTLESANLTISGNEVRFASTVDGLVNNVGSLTITSNLTRFEGQVGAVRLALLAFGDALVSTNLLRAGTISSAGQMIINAPALMLDATIAFTQGVDSALGQNNALTVQGNAVIEGNIGLADALSAVTVSGQTFFNAPALTVRTTGAQTYTGAASVGGEATLASIGGGQVRFGSTLNRSGGSGTLRVNTGGETRFDGAVGGTNQLTGLFTDAGGTTRLAGVTVNAATIDFGDRLVLSGVNTLQGGTVRLGGGADGAGATLAINSTNRRIDGSIGALNQLSELTTGAGGTTTINAPLVSAQTVEFSGGVLLDATTTVVGQSVLFGGALASVGGETNSLTVNSPATRFNGQVSGLGTLTTDGAGQTVIAGSQISAATINFNDAVSLVAPSVTISGGSVRFGSTLTGASNLALNTTTALAAGSVSGLTSLKTGGGNTLTLQGASLSAGTLDLGGSLVLDTPTLTVTADSATFGGVNSAGGVNTDLTVIADTTVFNGGVGLGQALGSVTTDADGTTAINAGVRTTGNQSYNDLVTLAGALEGADIEFATDLRIGSGAGVLASGGARFLGAVDGAASGDLTVDADTALFAQAIGATTALDSLMVTANEITIPTVVRTNAVLAFDGELLLTGDTQLLGDDVSITGLLRSADPGQAHDLLVDAATTRLAGDLIAQNLAFLGGVVLVGDTRIEATGDEGIFFFSTIDSDGTARKLTLQIDRDAIAGLTEEQLRERLTVERRPIPIISFGGDVGASSRLSELLLNVEGTRLDPAVYATIVGVSRGADGFIDLSETVSLSINADRFEMGRNEKFTILGNLSINAASEVILGDITTARNFSVSVDNDPASRIVLLVRPVGELLAPSSEADDVLGLVDGAGVLDRIDIVAGGSVTFSKAATLDVGGVILGSPQAIISGAGNSSQSVLTSNDVLFRLFPRTPIPLSELVLVIPELAPAPLGDGLAPLFFGGGALQIVLDFTSDGLTLAEPSGVQGTTGLFAETGIGRISDQVLISSSVRERLERIGVNARDPFMDEIVDAITGRTIYNDFSSEIVAADGVGQYAGEIVVNRLPRAVAEALVRRFEALVGQDDEGLTEFRAAVAAAFVSYVDEAPEEQLDDAALLAAGFAASVSERSPGSTVDAGLREVALLLREIESLGVTRYEYERALVAVLSTFTPDPDMTLEEFRTVVEWYKARLAGATDPGPTASAPGVDNVESAS